MVEEGIERDVCVGFAGMMVVESQERGQRGTRKLSHGATGSQCKEYFIGKYYETDRYQLIE
jgi:hypothetical protein